jgi:hypothetical protein
MIPDGLGVGYGTPHRCRVPFFLPIARVLPSGDQAFPATKELSFLMAALFNNVQSATRQI